MKRSACGVVIALPCMEKNRPRANSSNCIRFSVYSHLYLRQLYQPDCSPGNNGSADTFVLTVGKYNNIFYFAVYLAVPVIVSFKVVHSIVCWLILTACGL